MSCREEIKPLIERVDLDLSPRESLRKVRFHPSGRGMVVGGERFNQDRLFYSEDGGQNWSPSSLSFELGKIILDVHWVDENLAFASGLDGKILRSKDGGRSFSRVGQTDWLPLNGIASTSDSVVVVVGGLGYSEGLIWRSEDLGDSWTRVDTFDFEFRDIVFVEEGIAFACGFGAILKSIDAGLNWAYTPAENEFFSAMDFPTPTTGYAVGRTGTILKTEDGGESWETMRNGNLQIFVRQAYNDVFFESEDLGYIVGDKGLLLKTEDGGKNWAEIPWPGKDHLFGIDRNSKGELMISGESGGLWRVNE